MEWLSTRIGNEPDHRVTINLCHIGYIQPAGKLTMIHMVSGERLLVDMEYGVLQRTLQYASAKTSSLHGDRP
jgi:hypothetical protein